MIRSIITSDSAEPKFQSLASRNWRSMMSPNSQKLPLPKSREIANVVTAGMNTIVIPEITPGSESGSTTRRNTFTGFAPRSSAASRMRSSIFLSAV